MRTLCLLTALALSASAAAAPTTLTHSGRLLDSSGSPLEGTHSLTFSLYEASSGGNAEWTENLSVDLDNGFFGVILGEDTPVESDLFDGGPMYLGLAIDGGAELSRTPLSSVPWALNAEDATNVRGGVVDATEVKVGGNTVIESDGTINYSSITNVPVMSDTLSDLGCSSDEIASYNGSQWACAAISDLDINPSQLTGPLEVSQLPVGNTANHVAAGNHSHTELDALRNVTCEPGSFLVGFDDNLDKICRTQWASGAGYSVDVEIDTAGYGTLINQNIELRLDLDDALTAAGISGKTVNPSSIRVVDESAPPYREVPSRVLRTFDNDGEIYLWFNTQNRIENGQKHNFKVYFSDTDGASAAAPNYTLSPPGDFAVSYQEESTTLITGDYKGGFTYQANALPTVGGDGSHNCITPGDFDNDGDMDFIMVRYNASGVYFYQNIGNGGFRTFLSPTVIASSPAGGNTHCMAAPAGDFNKDGNLDIIVTRDVRGANGIRLYLGNGDGTFSDESFPAPTGSCWYREMDVADFDADGNLDVAQGTIYCNDWYIYWGGGNGTFGSRSTYLHPEANLDKYAVAAGDFSHDGRPDMLIGSAHGAASDAARGKFTNTGARNFRDDGDWQYVRELCNRGNVHGYAKPYDWNHDGFDDVIGHLYCDNQSERGDYYWQSTGNPWEFERGVRVGLSAGQLNYHGTTRPRLGNAYNYVLTPTTTAEVY